jgi:DNA-binding LacI/PurR family transcriptional regulator
VRFSGEPTGPPPRPGADATRTPRHLPLSGPRDQADSLMTRRAGSCTALGSAPRISRIKRWTISPPKAHGVPVVGSDHRDVGRLATSHLVEGGRRQVGTVTGPFRRRVVRSRLRGYEEALRFEDLDLTEDLVVESDWTPAGAARATQLLLEREPGLDAIFVHSDLMAVGVLGALAQTGRGVPDDAAVVSCDDLSLAANLIPSLTSVRLPLVESGAKAVEVLLDRISGAPVDPEPIYLPVELVVRESCGRRERKRSAEATAGSS